MMRQTSFWKAFIVIDLMNTSVINIVLKMINVQMQRVLHLRERSGSNEEDRQGRNLQKYKQDHQTKLRHLRNNSQNIL